MHVRVAGLVLAGVAATAVAAPRKPQACAVDMPATDLVSGLAPPSRCHGMLTLVPPGPGRGSITGTVMTSDNGELGWHVKIDDGKSTLYALFIGVRPPIAKGDRVTLRYRCTSDGACDARLDDAAGSPIAIISLGAGELANGWTSAVGNVLASAQEPDQREKSLRRTHALTLTKGKTSLTVRADHCDTVVADGVTWLVSGSAVSWDGVRPRYLPSPVDYLGFSLVRSK